MCIIQEGTRQWLASAGPPVAQPSAAQVCAYLSADMEALADKLELVLGWDSYVVSSLRINSHGFNTKSQYMITSVEQALQPLGAPV